ncbi:hypothetical protein B0H11DRAFT_1934310 [Mycena galericulata]|nr:hypothetical protein B0H11DRAFT_1934310 [Mycena galericulata]
MAPIFESLTKEYLWVLLSSSDVVSHAVLVLREAHHPATGYKGLQVDHIRHLLRIHRGVSALKPTPKTFSEAADWIVAEENLLVNWTYVAHGSEGPATSIDIKMREYYLKRLLDLPEHLEISSPLTPEPGSENLQPGAGEHALDSSGNKIRVPTPLPETRCEVWEGDAAELSLPANANTERDVFLKMVSYSPEADVKNYDPKVIVVNRVDPLDITIKRFHVLDINDFLVYVGVLRDEPREEERSQPHGPDDFSGALTVSVRTRLLVKLVIHRSPEFHFDGEAYQVSWMLPAFQNGHPIELLSTYHPDDVPVQTWAPNVDSNHTIPAIGPPNALRVVLIMDPLEREEPVQLTESQRVKALVVDYLLSVHGRDPILNEIQAHNQNNQTRAKGTTTKSWASWVVKMLSILNFEARVPSSVLTDAAKKMVNKTHLAEVVCAKSGWVSKCLKAATLIEKNRTHTKLLELLKEDGKSEGIEKFLSRVAGVLGKK